MMITIEVTIINSNRNNHNKLIDYKLGQEISKKKDAPFLQPKKAIYVSYERN